VLSAAINAVESNKYNWSEEFIIIYNKIVKAFMYYTIQDLSSTKAKIKFDISKDIYDYINDFTGNKIKLISDTTKQDVKYIILKNLEEGNRLRSIEYDLRKLYDGFGKKRAKVIARTEVAGISNYGSLMGAFEADAKTKKWIPILDTHTRDSHGDMTLHPEIELDQFFDVGLSKMLYPGDPNGAAEEVINCRCHLEFKK
jgi:uncharacterized protein with gpF-like domain